jgi:hypothetical protein
MCLRTSLLADHRLPGPAGCPATRQHTAWPVLPASRPEAQRAGFEVPKQPQRDEATTEVPPQVALRYTAALEHGHSHDRPRRTPHAVLVGRAQTRTSSQFAAVQAANEPRGTALGLILRSVHPAICQRRSCQLV